MFSTNFRLLYIKLGRMLLHIPIRTNLILAETDKISRNLK